MNILHFEVLGNRENYTNKPKLSMAANEGNTLAEINVGSETNTVDNGLENEQTTFEHFEGVIILCWEQLNKWIANFTKLM